MAKRLRNGAGGAGGKRRPTSRAAKAEKSSARGGSCCGWPGERWRSGRSRLPERCLTKPGRPGSSWSAERRPGPGGRCRKGSAIVLPRLSCCRKGRAGCWLPEPKGRARSRLLRSAGSGGRAPAAGRTRRGPASPRLRGRSPKAVKRIAALASKAPLHPQPCTLQLKKSHPRITTLLSSPCPRNSAGTHKRCKYEQTCVRLVLLGECFMPPPTGEPPPNGFALGERPDCSVSCASWSTQ